ncbi:MAG TPA: hypothetical protein PKW21_14235, partial [Rhabdaerophilum sp.]|nr:hypothetical protein [Rhabdaerophilum sp.]
MPRRDGRIVLHCEGEFASAGRACLRLDTAARPGVRIISGKFEGKPFSVKIKTAPGGYTLRHRGVTVLAQVATPRGAELLKKIPEKQKADT